MQDKKKIQANAAILFCKFELENTIDRIRNVGDSLSLGETNIEDAKETLAKLYKYILQLIDTVMPNLIYLGDTLEIMKMEEVMNKYGEDGWDVEFQLVEKRRLLFLWSREAAIITFSRKKN